MGFEGEPLVSNIPAVVDVPLAVLTINEDLPGNEDTDVPVAEFHSSV